MTLTSKLSDANIMQHLMRPTVKSASVFSVAKITTTLLPRSMDNRLAVSSALFRLAIGHFVPPRLRHCVSRSPHIM